MGAARSLSSRATTAISESADAGRTAGWEATGGDPVTKSGSGSGSVARATPPDWARRLQTQQRHHQQAHATAQAIKEGDKPGAPANPELDSQEG